MPKVSPSVLIIRLDAIGDALALTPALSALRRQAIPVDVVLRRVNARAFSSRALRDAIVANFELRSGSRSNVAAVEGLGRDLRARNYTHVLVATEDPAGYRLAAAVAAPARVGFEDPWSKPLKALWTRRLLTASVYRSARLTAATAHECESLFRLVAPLVEEERPTRDLARLRPLVLDADPVPDDRIAVQITDKWDRLGISFESVVELVRGLRAGRDPHLLSAAAESAYGQRVALATGIPVTYFDDLDPWKSAIGAAAAIVTPDCGALHVAGMVGTPVVAVFPPEAQSAARAARWAPWAAPHRILRADDGWPSRAVAALAQSPLRGTL